MSKSAILHQLRRALYALRFARKTVAVEPTSWLARRCVVDVAGGGSVTIGRYCELHPFSMILTYGGDIVLGDNCSLNPFSIIYGHGGVRIGNSVRIAAHSVIIPANHNTPQLGEALHESGVTMKGIEIDDNVWIGSGVRILDGVTIGEGAVVAAGAVVTKSVPAGATVAGVPARALGRGSEGQ